MTTISIADMLYVQKQNIQLEDYYPWLCIQVKQMYDDLTYGEIEKQVIPKLLEMVNLPTTLSNEDARHGIDLMIPADRYFELIKKGMDEVEMGEYILNDPTRYIPRTRDDLGSDFGSRFRLPQALMRLGILAEINSMDPQMTIVVD
jgi:hypothetical protein